MSDETTDDLQLGTSTTTWSEISHRSADDPEFYEAYSVPTGGLIAIVLVIAMLFVVALFYCVIRCERAGRQRELQYKQHHRDGSLPSSKTGTESSHPTDGMVRREGQPWDPATMEEGLILKAWPSEPAPVSTYNVDNDAHHNDKDEESSRSGNTEESSITPQPTDATTLSSSGMTPKRAACPICNKQFVAGDLVCSSYNQDCHHSFHKSCMFNWLEYQNKCPVCNETYLCSSPTATTALSTPSSQTPPETPPQTPPRVPPPTTATQLQDQEPQQEPEQPKNHHKQQEPLDV